MIRSSEIEREENKEIHDEASRLKSEEFVSLLEVYSIMSVLKILKGEAIRNGLSKRFILN